MLSCKCYPSGHCHALSCPRTAASAFAPYSKMQSHVAFELCTYSPRVAKGCAAAVPVANFALRALVRVRVPAACLACATAATHTLCASAPEKGQLGAYGPRKLSGAQMCACPHKCDVSMAALGRRATIFRSSREWPRALTNELVDHTMDRRCNLRCAFFTALEQITRWQYAPLQAIYVKYGWHTLGVCNQGCCCMRGAMRARGRHSVRSPRRESSLAKCVVGAPRGAVASRGELV